MEMHSKRLILRSIQDSDLEKVFEGLSNPQVIKYYGVSYKSLEASKAQMKWFADLERNKEGKWWAVCDKNSKEFLGACGFNNLEAQNRKAEIGLWLLPIYWGKGFMQEAIPLILHYGFDVMDLHRIEGFVEVDNTACKSALAKLGFRHEGTLRDCEVKNGTFISLDIYSLIVRK